MDDILRSLRICGTVLQILPLEGFFLIPVKKLNSVLYLISQDRIMLS